MDVSFIITVYNKEQYLHYCIQSLVKQKITVNVEYIFVDDCSTDNSVSVIESYAQELNNIKIVKMDRNKGVMAAVYKGLEQASGKYIQFIDADDQIAPNAIDYCVNLAKQRDVDFIKQLCVRNTKNDSFHLCKSLDIINTQYVITNSPFKYYCDNIRLVAGIGIFCEKQLFTRFKLTQDIFIQDGYLNNILFLYSKKAAVVKSPILYCSKELVNSISSNTLQLVFDKLTCVYHWYIDNKIEFHKKNIEECGSKMITDLLYTQTKIKLKKKSNSFIIIFRIYKLQAKYLRLTIRNNTEDENIRIIGSMIEDMYITYREKLRYPKYEN
jgi:glycosyltransferase involved in cell wall biosynthesis